MRHFRELVTTNPTAFLPNLATSLNNQASIQSAAGKRAKAVSSSTQAVRHYRQLADSNPDAFLPDLATSLYVHGNCLASLARLPEARDAARESLVCLAPFCARFPSVFDGLAKITLQDYLLRTQELGEQPDESLLTQYMDCSKQENGNDRSHPTRQRLKRY